MKRVGNIVSQVADLNNLYEAFRKACKGKQYKREVLDFRSCFDENIQALRSRILSGDVEVGKYHYFRIFDPKERKICAASFSERILHHALMNVCHPFFDKSLIDTTYATRKGKGVYAALDKAVEACGRYAFTAKLDVRKYYDSIDHPCLKLMLERKFKDRQLLSIFEKIIDSYEVSVGKGLPVGNLTSQYFANMYLSPLDHFAKEKLHVPVYIRYMDDILIAGESKAELRNAVRQVCLYALEKLCLIFKPPIFRESGDGQVFLGYKVLPYRCELSGRSKRRFRSKLLAYTHYYEQGMWSQAQYQEHLLPLLSFVNHAVCHNFCKSCLEIG